MAWRVQPEERSSLAEIIGSGRPATNVRGVRSEQVRIRGQVRRPLRDVVGCRARKPTQRPRAGGTPQTSREASCRVGPGLAGPDSGRSAAPH